jgi:hypothetical protein
MKEIVMIRVLCFLCFCGVFVIPVRAEEIVSDAVATNAKGSPPRGEPHIPAGDPFAMRGVADGDGFVSAGPAAIPPGIRVVGILAIAGKSPIGALSIPGSPNIHFVREGDVVQIDRPAGSATAGATDSQLYLLVKSITHGQVEIAPRTRPQDVRIYR